MSDLSDVAGEGSTTAEGAGPGGEAGTTVASGGRTAPDDGPRFPPDEVLDLPAGLTFVRVLLVVALAGALVDLARVGLPSGPIPYSYQFLVGVVYLLVAIPFVRRMHSIFDEVRAELVDIADRGTMLGGRASPDLAPGEIDAEMTETLRWGFRPTFLLGGAVVGGTFGVAVMYALGVLDAYPHLLTDFTYAAVHGLYYGPLIGGVLLVRRITAKYIVDVDVLAPDGMGGYRAIGDGLFSLVTYAVVLVTLDFVVLSSVSFLDEPLFQTAVTVIYVAMLVTFVVLALVAAVAIRRQLLAVRDEKVDDLREEFEEVEAAYWDKRHRGEDTRVEAADLRTMRAMFDELNGMALWPLNVYALAKLSASVGSSLVVFALKRGLVSLPF